MVITEVIDCVYFKIFKCSIICSFFHFVNSSLPPSAVTSLTLSHYKIKVGYSTRKKKKKRSEHIIFYIFNLSLKKSHPPVVRDNETQRQTGNGDGDTCVYTITDSI